MIRSTDGGRHRGVGAAVTVLALCAALGACADRPPPAPAAVAAGAPPVIAPGGPGEPARTISPEQAAQLRPPAQVSPADVAFVSMMIPHHEQALLMSGLAPARALDPGVRAIAERIAASQEPEIAVMESWMTRRATEHAGHGDHHDSGGPGHTPGTGDMAGMASPAQIASLGAASGDAFDRMFLELMIVHHEGAIAMAYREQVGGTDAEALQLADHIVSSQSAEIARMQALIPRP